MSYGMMRSEIEIYSTVPSKDAEGFATKEDQLFFITKAYKEEQRGSEAWKNRAAFSTATTLFRFRKPPEVEILTEYLLVCKGVRYNILSVEDVRDKGMYVEVLAERVTGSKG
ncbi:head-tail adaptor protein [Alkalibacter rhizosphaerae]|uniref:Head-tail adaptor protein n=1 Tax=Alkalibacter rhizosphaerae TaxID=2815577 RepID=A0A974XIT1_9FIRM|nr:head-tail adaptor protein [Alkalibacter rhizosphaerae]QSX09540.1 head-tail adaptor protein [Alkalibacter rhizosphaerae]